MRDPSDFHDWYQEQYLQVVTVLCVVTGDAEAAAAAADEAFVRTYERWDRVRALASPSGWLHATALACAARQDRWRRVRRRVMREAPAAPVAPASAMFDADVWTAVQALTRPERTVVALRYVLDLSESEVGQVMGLPRGEASTLLAVARRKVATLSPPEPDEQTEPTQQDRPTQDG